MLGLLFFFKQKTAYEMRISDWSSDVCSSDLNGLLIETASKHVQLVPAVDLGSVTLSRLWMLARTGDGLPTTHGELAGHARALIEQAEADFEKRHEATTLRDWLSSQGRS